MQVPKLKFIYALPLDRMYRNLAEENNQTYPSVQVVKEISKKWNDVWSKFDEEKELVKYMSKLTGRVPERALECFVIGGGLMATSTPFIFATQTKKGNAIPDEHFIDIVIHELLHIFVTHDSEKYWSHISEKYKNEDVITRNHVIIYAMLADIYKEILAGEPLDYGRDSLPIGYRKAVDIVKKEGYKNLISEYHELA